MPFLHICSPAQCALTCNRLPFMKQLSEFMLSWGYSLLAFRRDFQLFGSSKKNPHKSAKVPSSRIVFNLEREMGQRTYQQHDRSHTVSLTGQSGKQTIKQMFILSFKGVICNIVPDHQMLSLWVTLVVNILLIAHLKPSIGGNLLKVLASGMTTSSSNLESPLGEQGRKS